MPFVVSGLDLGQTTDSTALATLERDDCSPANYKVLALQRFPLGTPYPAIVNAVCTLFQDKSLAGTLLLVDQTGVGRPVCDLFRISSLSAGVLPLTITSGHRATMENGEIHCPKKELVSALQILFQARRISIPKAIPEGEILKKELQSFQVKITTSANEVYGAWREGAHDDLVLALAMAAWYAERSPWGPGAFSTSLSKHDRGSEVYRAPKGVFLE